GNTYTDSEGVTWTWVKGNPTPETSPGGANWFDADSGAYKTTQDLEPEFINCPEPGRQRIPQDDPDCPDWNSPPVTYTDPSGDIWVFDPAGPAWINTSDPEANKADTTDELPGYTDLCDPQEDIPEEGWLEPQCPHQYVHEESNSLSWTAYVTQDGVVWTFNPFLPRGWTNRSTGDFVAGDDPSAIPGYDQECPPADREGRPCPPIHPAYQETWVNPDNGEVWVYTIDPRDIENLAWVSELDGTALSALGLRFLICPIDIDWNPEDEPECPPGKPMRNDTWVDTMGNTWVYAANTGGADGWDNLSTEWIENFLTRDLPNQPDCLPVDERPCPPIVKVIDGTVWYGSNGNLYIYSATDGGWVDNTDPDSPVIAYTVLLPGYRDDCLPPCPPLILERGALGIWVDPSNGEVWIKPQGGSQWYRIPDGMTIDNTRDLPFYTEDCLPPCDPESDGGPTYQYDENEVPVAPEDDKEYDDTKDQAVTVEPGDEAPKLTQIVEELVNATTAVGDDCNPEGCVEPDATPELGHLFRDSNGIVWRYVGDSRWQAEDGAYVYDVLDIPGYVDACLPPDVPLERECPEEYEGARYTDSNGIEWIWVGFSPDPAASDHGQHWFHRYEDGSTEYRYTVELEDFFEDCPAPPDLVIQTTGIFVSLRGPKQICVGDSAIVILTARPSDGATINSTLVEADGDPIIGIQSTPEVWTYGWTPGQPGVYNVKGGASDTSGATESDLIVIVVIDCGDNTDQSTPLPINVAFNAETQVCVGDKFVFQVIVTLDPSASLASLDVTRDGAAQSVGQQNPTTWSGSFLADAEGEVELVATGTDSNGTSDTARHYIKVIS
ncbi:MAG: hypothetical protein ACO3Z1_08215, partial [Ilumatobacteraceae bacterium]